MRILYTLLLVGLTGCSSVYHPKESHVPEGYYEQKLSQNEYEVSFESYQGESWGELEGYLFKRAGEIGVDNNFQFYSVSNLKRIKRVEVVNIPARVMPEVMGNCGACASSGLGMVSPEYQKEYHILRITGTFTYDIKANKTYKVSAESL